MTNAVSKTNVINSAIAKQTVANNQDDVKKLVKYVSGEALTQAPDTFTSNAKSAAGSALLFDGTPLAMMAIRNKKTKGIGSETLKKLDAKSAENVKNLFKGEGKLSQRITDFVVNNTKNRQELDSVKSFIKTATKSDKASAKAAKAVEKAAKKAAKAENGGFFSRLSADRAIKKATKATAKSQNARYAFLKGKYRTGAAATGKAAAQTAGKTAGKLGNFGKVFKSSGAGFMLALSGIMEGATEVVPTFKELGAKKGMKQLGKSTIKVAGDTAGFVVGNQVGTAVGAAAGAALAGTKVGAAIGSVFPGFGTAIGAVVGCACGFLGSWVAGKITKKITGKSEREKAKEAQEKQQAELVSNNSKSLEELKAQAALKIQEEYQTTGKISPDSEEALKILENLEQTNPYQVA